MSDPFANTEKKPSVSFKGKPIGTKVGGYIVAEPKLVQARDYKTKLPAFWKNKDGSESPKMTVVTTLDINGTDTNLWAPKPSSMFAAIQAAQTAARQQLSIGGYLEVEFYDEKPTESGEPQKLYRAVYTPPTGGGVFGSSPVADDDTPPY